LRPFHSTKKSIFFNELILGLIDAGQKDPVQIAEWMGVEKDLVLLIIATELKPNEWIDSHTKSRSKVNLFSMTI
jgi:hypothetical protein